MISIGNVLPAVATISSGHLSKGILDLIFRDCALWMNDTGLLTSNLGSAIDIPFPLLGFSFETPESFTIAKYTYAKYPYLNKVAVANAFLKEVCPFSIKAYRPITRTNPLALNFIANYTGIKYYIEKYADKGGTWSLITMWGIFNNLVLTELNAFKINENDIGGVGFEFSFEKLNFDATQATSASVSSLAKKLGGM